MILQDVKNLQKTDWNYAHLIQNNENWSLTLFSPMVTRSGCLALIYSISAADVSAEANTSRHWSFDNQRISCKAAGTLTWPNSRANARSSFLLWLLRLNVLYAALIASVTSLQKCDASRVSSDKAKLKRCAKQWHHIIEIPACSWKLFLLSSSYYNHQLRCQLTCAHRRCPSVVHWK